MKEFSLNCGSRRRRLSKQKHGEGRSPVPLPGLCPSARRGPRTRGLPPQALWFIWRGSLCTQIKQGSRHLVQDPNGTMGCTGTGAFSRARTSDASLSHSKPGRGNLCSDEGETSRALKHSQRERCSSPSHSEDPQGHLCVGTLQLFSCTPTGPRLGTVSPAPTVTG